MKYRRNFEFMYKELVNIKENEGKIMRMRAYHIFGLPFTHYVI